MGRQFGSGQPQGIARTKWANAILGKGRTWHTQMIGQMRFGGNGRQFCFGQPQGIARTKWANAILGNGRMLFARTKWGIRPDGQTWGDGNGANAFWGEWGDNSVEGDHKGRPYKMGRGRLADTNNKKKNDRGYASRCTRS